MSDELYRPGLEGVIAGESRVSTVQGGLLYRGYPIEELAERSTYEEVAYLILYGELPKADELKAFRQRLASQAAVPGAVIEMLRHIPNSAPLMDVMRSGASYLAHWDPDLDDTSPEARLRKAERMLARLPTVLAAKHRLRQGKEPVAPDKHRSLPANLLWMISRQEPSERLVRALDVSLILYAEHEFNASTFTARVICSTMSDIYSAVTGAIGALKGPLHGGANERAMEVLSEVGSVDNAERWVRQALAEKRRIMGFGHRVYKQGDPRAAILKPLCAELAQEIGEVGIETIAETIERVVLEEKGLRPNVDWPCARLYYYLGLPIDLYTPLFVVARVAGWSAHFLEQAAANRLIRPLSRYTGPDRRSFVPLEERR
jgi:2-methylcitrate synthase/citrate synthase II